MPAGYRDELDAAYAAHESLRNENAELRAQLARCERALLLQQQQFSAGLPPRRNRSAFLIVAVIGVLVVTCLAGMGLFVVARPIAPRDIEPPQVITVPTVNGLRPNGLPWTDPAEVPRVQPPMQRSTP